MPNPIDRALALPGMMQQAELEWLYEASKRMHSIIEIGSYMGKSTSVLCAGCLGQVYAIDPHNHGDCWPERPPGTPQDTYAAFMENLKEFDNLVVARMTSEEAARNGFVAPEVDMLWVDGDHEKAMVLQDLQLWVPRTRKLICGHDFDESRAFTPGVEQALNEYFGAGRACRGPGSIWYFEKGV